MKIPKKQNIEVGSFQDPLTTGVPSFEVWDYSHNNRQFGEIAGHVFSHYLKVREENQPLYMGTRFVFTFQSSNPNKAGLYLSQVVADLDKTLATQGSKIKEVVYEDAIHNLVNKALDAVDILHNLKKSYKARLKFLFNPNF